MLPYDCEHIASFFQEAFAEVALFFHDVYGGNLIGVVWKPQSFVATKFKVYNTHFIVVCSSLSLHFNPLHHYVILPASSCVPQDALGEPSVK